MDSSGNDDVMLMGGGRWKFPYRMFKFFLFMPVNGEGVNWVPAAPECSFVILYDYYDTSQFLQVVKCINNKL